MLPSLKSYFRSLPVIVIGLTVICCISIVGISTIKTMVFERCIENYANKLGVQPTTIAVTTKLFEMITPRLSTDMTVEDVHKEFNEVVPSKFYQIGVTLEGGSHEIVTLNICPGVGLDTILIDFTKDNYFDEAKLYFGD